MSITSVDFWVMVIISLLFYYIMPFRNKWIILLISSIVFLVSANGYELALISMVLVFWSYFAALLISKTKVHYRVAKGITIFAIIGIVGCLFFFKEQIFFVNTANSILELTTVVRRFSVYEVLAPLGISYFALTLISYICEVFWETIEVQKNPFKFLTFGLYFPVLTSGPILKYKDSSEEIFSGHEFNYTKFCFGLQRIGWGLFKKMVISERLSIIVTTIYSNNETYMGLYVPIASVLFVLQLYTDFSGCIDIIIGISELYGIKLPENFDLPFYSKTISEFWRRWHITLGGWLKEYILYPILKSFMFQKLGSICKKRFGKKIGKKIPTWIALLISWFLIGFWHGGGYNYIFGVGIFMGIIIIGSEMFEPYFNGIKKNLKINDQVFSWKLFQIIRTFSIFSFGLSFFRASSLTQGLNMWKSVWGNFNPWIFFDGSLNELGLNNYDFRVLQISILIMGLTGVISIYTGKNAREWISEQNLVFRWLVWILLVLSILVFGKYGSGYDATKFIYGMF